MQPTIHKKSLCLCENVNVREVLASHWITTHDGVESPYQERAFLSVLSYCRSHFQQWWLLGYKWQFPPFKCPKYKSLWLFSCISFSPPNQTHKRLLCQRWAAMPKATVSSHPILQTCTLKYEWRSAATLLPKASVSLALWTVWAPLQISSFLMSLSKHVHVRLTNQKLKLRDF